jgi:hypothetical protein
MRQIFTLLAGATLVIMNSCSSTHKVSQTPDDVYYSPGSPKSTHTASSVDNQDEYYSTAPNDQYVRMKTVDESRWSYFDDYNNYDSYYSPMTMGAGGYYGSPVFGYGYGYSPLSIGFGMDPYFGWNSYFLWNSCYNPYFYNPYYGAGVVLVNPKISPTPVYSHLRTFNPSSYNSTAFSNGNSNRFYRPGTTTTSSNNSGSNYRYNNSNNNYRPANTGGGSTRTFTTQPTRSFSAPSGGGGSGGGGGGFRPVRH